MFPLLWYTLYFAAEFWVLVWGVTLWLLDMLGLARYLAALLSSMLELVATFLSCKAPCCRSDSIPDSIILAEVSSTTLSSSEAGDEVASCLLSDGRLSDASDVNSETEETLKCSPATSWGPSSSSPKLPTPAKPASIYVEVGSHGNVYGAGYINLFKLLAMVCVKVNVPALPSGAVWGDVMGFSATKAEDPTGKAFYQLQAVDHYWVNECPNGLATHRDLHKAFKDADDYW